MIILVRRGDFRAALASVLPHAGKESEDTPDLGRVRFAPWANDLTVYCTDHGTGAVATARITSHVDGDVATWDLSVQACKQALAVFTGPSNPDARAYWEDGDLRIELTPEQAVVQEVDQIPGRTRLLRVPRILLAGEDRYPDIPRTVHNLLTALPSRTRRHDLAGVYTDGGASVAALSKLVSSGKAWGDEVSLVHAGRSWLASCGPRFLAVVPDTEYHVDREAHGLMLRTDADRWVETLDPIRRPVPPPRPPAEVVDDLAAQAGRILGAGATGRLTVVLGDLDVDEDDTMGTEPLPFDDGEPDDGDVR